MRRLPISWSDSFLARLGYRRQKARRPYQGRRSLFEALEVRAMLSGTPNQGVSLPRPEYVIVSEIRADNQPSDQFVVHTEYATNGTPQAVVSLRDGLTAVDDTLHTLQIELQLGTSVLERQEVMIDIESQAFRDQFLQDRLDRASADVTDVDNLTLQTLIDTLALQSQTGGPALPSGTEPNKITSEELGILAKNLRVKGQLDGGATTKVNLYTAIESKVQDVTADESTANTEADQAAIAEEGKQVGEAALLLADRVGRDLASENANVKAAAESLRDALIESGDLQYTVFAGLGTNQEVYRETTDQRQFVLGFVETGTYELTSHLRIELGSEQGVVQTTQLEGVSGSQAPLTTYIGEDTYVSEASPNSNYGSATELKVRNVAGSNEVALVAVNLAAEQGQVPSDAQLKLATVGNVVSGIKHKVSAYYKTWAVSPKVFDEGATTWTTYTNSLAAGFREWAGNSFNNDSVIVAGVNSADITVAVQRALLLGDSNADGKVSVSNTYGPALGDVTAFYQAVRDWQTYVSLYGGVSDSPLAVEDDELVFRNDANWDGEVDQDDVAPFFERLNTGQANYDLNTATNITDYNVWSSNYRRVATSFTQGDGNFDGWVDDEDYKIWYNAAKITYGAVRTPELILRVESTAGSGEVKYASKESASDPIIQTDYPQQDASLASFRGKGGSAGQLEVALRVLHNDIVNPTLKVFQRRQSANGDVEELLYESSALSGAVTAPGTVRTWSFSPYNPLIDPTGDYTIVARLYADGVQVSERSLAGGYFKDAAGNWHIVGTAGNDLVSVYEDYLGFSGDLWTAAVHSSTLLSNNIYAHTLAGHDRFELGTDTVHSVWAFGGDQNDTYYLLGNELTHDVNLQIVDDSGVDKLDFSEAYFFVQGVDLENDEPQTVASASGANLNITLAETPIEVVSGLAPQLVHGPGYNGLPIVVDSLDDLPPVAGAADNMNLRKALAVADAIVGFNTIEFGAAAQSGVITLNHRELLSSSDVEVIGPGMDQLVIDAQAASRVFMVYAGAATLRGLTLTGGRATEGAGVYTFGDLTLQGVRVKDNEATTGYGGGIYVYDSLVMEDSIVERNKALAALGGGIYVGNIGHATIQSSTIDRNEACYGAGIYGYLMSQDQLVVERSTISRNEANTGGGLLILGGAGSLTNLATITNSTISTNEAVSGGGVWLQGGSNNQVTLINDTVAYNTGNFVGGIVHYEVRLRLYNTIVAENSANWDLWGWPIDTTSSYNLLGRGYNGALLNTNHNIVLGPSESAGLSQTLGAYGGPTETHALAPTSPAIDAGLNASVPSGPTDYDQRGAYYTRAYDDPNEPNVGAGSTTTVDIGAFEYFGQFIWREAERTTLTDPTDPNAPKLEVIGDITASGSRVLSVFAAGDTTIVSEPSSATSSIASYDINVLKGGDFRLWMRVVAPSANANGIWWRVNGGAWTLWDAPTTGGSELKWYNAVPIELDAGNNTVELASGDDGVQIDMLFITDNVIFQANNESENDSEVTTTKIVVPATVRDFHAGNWIPPTGATTMSHPDFQLTTNTGSGETLDMVQQNLPFPVPVINGTPSQLTGSDEFSQWFTDSLVTNRSAQVEARFVHDSTRPGVYKFVGTTGAAGNANKVATTHEFFPADDALFAAAGAEHEDKISDGDNATTNPDREADEINEDHNYGFTAEIRAKFRYDANAAEQWLNVLRANDDLWIFVNGQRVVDLGGIHGSANQYVDLKAMASTLGLTGTTNWYSLDIFYANRSTDDAQLSFELKVGDLAARPLTMPEENRFLTDYRQTVILAPGTKSLTFNIADLNFDTSDANAVNDAFELALVDATGQAVVPTIGSGRDAFLNITEGENYLLAAGATYNITSGLVTVDVSQLATGVPYVFVTRLVNNDHDTGTTVAFPTGIQQLTVPVATQDSALASGDYARSHTAPLDVTQLDDVTDRFDISYSHTTFDEIANVLRAGITLTSNSRDVIRGPLLVVVRDAHQRTGTGALATTLFEADGLTPEGDRFYELTPQAFLADDRVIELNDVISGRDLVFEVAGRTQFDYEIVILGQLNDAPAFTNDPRFSDAPSRAIEIKRGNTFTFDAEASDPNEDDVEFSFVTQAGDLQFDTLNAGKNTDGKITWVTTLSTPLGRYDVRMRVTDEYGLYDAANDRVFTIVVQDGRNRAPYFIEPAPITVAYVGSEYPFDAEGFDPDIDPITYSLNPDPTKTSPILLGLAAQGKFTVNSSTGEIAWTPSADLVGQTLPIELLVSDGALTGNLPYAIKVLADPEDNWPKIVSSPVTNYEIPGPTVDPSTRVLVVGSPDNRIDLDLEPGESTTVEVRVRHEIGGDYVPPDLDTDGELTVRDRDYAGFNPLFTNGYTYEDLLGDILTRGGETGVQIENVVSNEMHDAVSGDRGIGIFQNGTGANRVYGMDDYGIVLSNGDVKEYGTRVGSPSQTTAQYQVAASLEQEQLLDRISDQTLPIVITAKNPVAGQPGAFTTAILSFNPTWLTEPNFFPPPLGPAYAGSLWVYAPLFESVVSASDITIDAPGIEWDASTNPFGLRYNSVNQQFEFTPSIGQVRESPYEVTLSYDTHLTTPSGGGGIQTIRFLLPVLATVPGPTDLQFELPEDGFVAGSSIAIGNGEFAQLLLDYTPTVIGFQPGVTSFSLNQEALDRGVSIDPSTGRVQWERLVRSEFSAPIGNLQHNDVSQIDITFSVQPGATRVGFNVVFGSEEYPEYVPTPFIDAFGIFVGTTDDPYHTNIATWQGQPLNVAHPEVSDASGILPGTELDGLLFRDATAQSLNPVIPFTIDLGGLPVPGPSGLYRLTFIIADTHDTALDTTVYITGLGVVPPGKADILLQANPADTTVAAIVADDADHGIIYENVQPARPSDPASYGWATYQVTFTGDGAAHAYNLQFVDANGAGYDFGTIPVAINSDYFYLVEAIDPDPTDTLTFSLLEKPDGPFAPLIQPTTGRITWDPIQYGAEEGNTYDFTVQVVDGRGGHDEQSFTVTIGSDITNHQPEIVGPSEILQGATQGPTATASRLFTLNVLAHDADNDQSTTQPLQYYLTAKPDLMTINRDTGIITWTPTASQANQSYPVTVKVYDGHGGAAAVDFSVTAQEQDSFVNHRPTFIAAPDSVVLDPDTPMQDEFSFRLRAQDLDHDKLTFRWNGPKGFVFSPDGDEADLFWSPDKDVFGVFPVVITITDGRLSEHHKFTITVMRSNDVPRFLGSETEVDIRPSLPAEEEHHFLIRAFDPYDRMTNTEIAPVRFSITDLPSWLAADVVEAESPSEPLTGYTLHLHGYPLVVGDYQFHVVATDTTDPSLFAERTFSIHVLEPRNLSTNTRPEFNSPPTSVGVGQLFYWKIELSDKDDDTVIQTALSYPDFLTYDPATQTLSGIPGPEDIGGHEIYIQVNDQRGENNSTNEDWFTLEVTGIPSNNHPPQIIGEPRPTAVVGKPYVLQFHAEDEDPGDVVRWELLDRPTGELTFDPTTGRITWLPEERHLGEVTFTVRAIDTYPAYDEVTLTVPVRILNSPPQVVNFNPPRYVTPGEAIEYASQIVDEDKQLAPLTYQLFTAGGNPKPEWLDANANGMLVGTAPATGLENLELWVSDGAAVDGGYTLVLPFTMEVVAPSASSVNEPPKFLNELPAFVKIGTESALSFTPVISDDGPDNEIVLTLVASVPPVPGLALSPDGKTVLWDTTAGGLEVGVAYTVTIRATDNSGNGASAYHSRPIVLLGASNGVPAFVAPLPPSTIDVVPGGKLRVPIYVTDDPGDELTFSLSGNVPETMDIIPTSDRTALLTWDVPLDAATSDYLFDIHVQDQLLQEASHPVHVHVVPDETAPTVTLSASREAIVAGESVTLSVHVTDDGAIKNVILTAQPPGAGASFNIPLNANYQATLPLALIGTYTFTANATDMAGNPSLPSNEVTLQVLDPIAVGLPSVALEGVFKANTTTLITDTITELADVQFSIDYTGADPNMLTYTLELVDASTGKRVAEVTSGTGTVNDSLTLDPKPTIDPTFLPNGSFLLRLTAVDILGNTASDERYVEIDTGRLKVGNFAISFVDLQVPVSGIPITISRSYDTTRAGGPGDFGYGWQLDIETTNAAIDYGDSEEAGRPFIENTTRVVVTLPDGTTEGFTFYVEDIPIIGNASAYSLPRFAPDGGVTSQLIVKDEYLVDVGNGKYQDPDGKLYNPLNTSGAAFTLHTRSGLEYVYDAKSGKLSKLIDRVGNELEFRDDGIFSSTGRGIDFVRDEEGRIQKIVDPNHLEIVYEYDPQTGDLVKVTNRELEETTFVYGDSTRDHFLTEILNHEGNTVLKPVFDANGRLDRLYDAADAYADFDYPPIPSGYTGIGAIERVKDANGVPTEIVRDLRGNVIRRIQRLDDAGTSEEDDDTFLITAYQYDANDNQTHVSQTYGFRADELSLNAEERYRYPTTSEPVWLSIAEFDPDTNDVLTRKTLLEDDRYATTTFAYDVERSPFGQPVYIIDTNGTVTENNYDPKTGNLLGTTVRDKNGNVLSESGFSYQDGVLTGVSDALGRPVSSFTYNEFGDLTSTTTITDSGNVTRFFVYDEFGQQTLSYSHWEDPADGDSNVDRTLVSRTYYDDEGRVTGTAQYTLSGPRDFTAATDLDGETPEAPDWSTSTQYDKEGRVIKSFDRFQNESVSTYDLRGNLVESRTSGKDDQGFNVWVITRTLYDINGRAFFTTDPYVVLKSAYSGTGTSVLGTHTTYDALGRVMRTARYNGAVELVRQAGDFWKSTTTSTFPAGGEVSESRTYYDEAGRVEFTVDAAKLITQYHYDTAGRQDSVTQYLTGKLDNDTAPTTVIQEFPLVPIESATTSFQYDDLGRQWLVTDALLHATRTEYDALGRAIKTIFHDGTVTETRYNQLGQREAEIAQYDPKDLTSKNQAERDAYFAKITTTYEYDLAGRLTAVNLPEIVNPLNNPLNPSDRIRPRTEYQYDAFGNQTAIITNAFLTADGLSVKYYRRSPATGTDAFALSLPVAHQVLDAGQLTQVTATTYTYDAAGHQTSRILPIGVASTTNANDFVERNIYDSLGRQVRHVDFEGHTTDYIYDQLGRLDKKHYFNVGTTLPATPGTGDDQGVDNNVDEAVDYIYDAFGREQQVIQDFDGDLLSTADQRVTINAYDAEGRLESTSSPEGVLYYDYFSATGQLKSTSTASKTAPRTKTEYAYDRLSRLATVTASWLNGVDISDEKTDYRYDKVGNLDQVELPNNVISDYDYDALNRLTKLVQFRDIVNTSANQRDASEPYIATYDYTVRADGKRTGAIENYYTPGGTVPQTNIFVWSYDALGRLTEERFSGDGTLNDGDFIAQYTFDLVGNRTKKETDNNLNFGSPTDPAALLGIAPTMDERITYEYDPNDRLWREKVDTGANGSIDKVVLYKYGPNANFVAGYGGDGTQQTFRGEFAGPDLTGGGNTTQETSYFYNVEGRLATVVTDSDGTAVVGGTLTSTYKYNDAGLRVEQNEGVTLRHLIDEQNPTGNAQTLEVKDGAGAVQTSYTLGLDIVSQWDGNGLRYLAYDGHGSTRALLDSSGAVVSGQRFAYDAYGNMIAGLATAASAQTRLLYSGEWTVSSGLQYLRDRWQRDGRFLSMDRHGGNAQDPQSLHRYTYTTGDPILGTDPTGFETLIGLSSASSIGSSLNNLEADIGQKVAELALAVVQGASATTAFVSVFALDVFGAGVPVLTEAFGSLLGAIQKNAGAVLGKFLPSVGGKPLLPGILHVDESQLKLLFTRGYANVGNSGTLRSEYAKLIGVAGDELKYIDAQFHHLIPVDLAGHRLLQKLNFQVDSALNALPLLNTVHRGPHDTYSQAIRLILDDIANSGLKTEQQRELVLATMTKASATILDGNPLRQSALSVTEWFSALRPTF